MLTHRLLQMAASTGAEESGWNGWESAWAGSALSGYTTETNFGNTFGGAYDVAFNEDGTSAYVCGSSNKIREWSLGTAYDFSTASLVTTSNPTGSGTYVTNLHFSPNGDQLMFCDWSNDRMGIADLGTPWVLSTLGTPSYSTTTIISSGSVGSTFLTSDGKKLFVTNRNSTIREYSMGSAGDVSTLSFVGSTVVASTNWYGVYFSGDGLTLYLGNRGGRNVVSFSLSSPYDLSTASSSQTLIYSSGVDSYGIRLTNSGARLWVGDGSTSAGDILLLEN